MRRPFFAFVLIAAAAVSCSSSTQEPPAGAAAADVPRPGPAPTTQAELDQLRAENAALRAQLGTARRETAVSRNQVAEVRANTAAIETGKLRPGLTVYEAHKAVTGSATLRKDTCQLTHQTADEWTYRLRSDGPTGGPGSGGTSNAGVNMRGSAPVVIQTWDCTFDARTGMLKSFKRVAE